MAEGSAQSTSEKTSAKNQDQTQDVNNPQFRLLTRVKFWHFVGTEEEAVQKEIHEKRLENLRKELVGLKNTEWQYDPIAKHIDDTDHKRKEFNRVLELAQTEWQEYVEANCITSQDEDLDEDNTEAKCLLSNGKITSLNNEAGMINRDIPFSLSKAHGLHLSEGQTVSYMWYKTDNDVVKVCRIVKIIEENWNEPITGEEIEEVRRQRPQAFSTYLVTKVGFISRKVKDVIDVDDEDEKHTFSLDNVEATFMPQVYDQVSIVCRVQRDPKLLDEAGVTVEVVKMEPNITKQIQGKITSVHPNHHGIIAEKYVFLWDALVSDYRIVNVGDKVTAECIQCEKVNDSVFQFRCLKVVLIEGAKEAENEMKRFQPKKKAPVNMNGIEISDDVEVELNDIDEAKEFTMTVKNTAAEAQKVLETVFIGNKSKSQLKLVSHNRNDSFFLQPNEERTFKFEAKAKMFGEAPQEKIYVKFSGPAGCFKIYRNIVVILNDVENLYPFMGTDRNTQKNLSYTQRVARLDQSGRTVIQGVPAKRTSNFVKIKFKHWDVPPKMKAIVNDPNNSHNFISETLDESTPMLRANLELKIYSGVFHTLLHLEECEMFHNMRKYDKKSFFKREGEYLSLAVKNIAESRPSLVIGDSVKAFSPFSSATQQEREVGYEGFIHAVKNDRVLLRFNDAFHAKYNSEDYNIYFYFSRKPLQKQHHAIDLVKDKLPNVLFPNKIVMNEKQLDVQLNVETGELSLDNSIVPWFNPLLNIVQKQAVTNILQGVARPVPYVIFGPPGTGKTVTLIETVLQLYKKVPHSRILIATPSNSAANLITERIVDSGILRQGEFIRLVSENSIQKETIPDTIIRHCGTIDIAIDNTSDDGVKHTISGLQMNCNSRNLKLRRVLIGTCITLGTLMQCDFRQDHFTHVIIDESGQCTETEIMIPISFADNNIGQIILAGDPMQLGPIILSNYAKNRGLEQSYLVRLLDRVPYKSDPERFERRYDPRLITKLVYNYRSLPSIMSVYNDLFYDADLKAMVNDVDSVEAELVKQLRPIFLNEENENYTEGVIFVGVEGKSTQCIDSPSWLNTAEANNVLQFLMKLMKVGANADDIGIITPYTQQVKIIRKAIEVAGLIQPKVGTVEEFQGQERQIILVSTVRTAGREMSQSDKKHNLGFVKSPKRMNVAISRARALLVVFGSPRLLIQDENWKFLIEHCVKNDSYINFDPAVLSTKVDSEDDDE